MAGLLDYLSNLKYEPDAASMGLMNMGAQMMANSGPSRLPTNFLQQLGGGVQGFNQGYTAQKNEEQALALVEQKKLLDAATINKDNAMAGYYNTGGAGQNTDNLRQSTDGWFRVNNETKAPEFLVGPNGQRLMPQGSDLNLIRAKHSMAPVQTVDANGNVDVVSTASLDPFYAQGTQDNISQPQPQADISEEQIVEAYQNNQITKEQAISALRSIAPPGMMPNEISLNVSRQASPGGQARQTPAQREASLANARVPAAVAQAGQSEAAKVAAEAQIKAQLELPNNIAQAQNLSDLTNQMLNHPGLSGVVGMPNFQGAIPFPGTKEADFKALLEQVKGKAFLQAFDSLKGGGAISEAEGIKASQALARLQTSQTESSFKNSLQEFNNIVSNSANRMKQRAGGNNQLNTQPQNSPSIDDLVNHYGGGK